MKWIDRLVENSHAYKCLLHSTIQITDERQHAQGKNEELLKRLDVVEEANGSLQKVTGELSKQCTRLAKMVKNRKRKTK